MTSGDTPREALDDILAKAFQRGDSSVATVVRSVLVVDLLMLDGERKIAVLGSLEAQRYEMMGLLDMGKAYVLSEG